MVLTYILAQGNITENMNQHRNKNGKRKKDQTQREHIETQQKHIVKHKKDV